jgi:flagellar protein FliO/FliZ
MNKASKGKYLSIVDTVTIGMNKQLYLVKAGNQFILLASSGKNLEFIKEVKLDEIDEETDLQTNNTFDFKAIFDKYFQNFKNKKPDIEEDANTSMESSRFKDNLQRLKILSSKFGKPTEDYGDDNINEK